MRVPPHVEYGHAWLESPDGETVFDPESDMVIPRVLYYAVGNIEESDCFKYTKDEVRRMALEFKHYGPWEGVDAAPPLDDDDEEDWG